jgi:demethylmenaquinone methyltransferase / 2-methoxy-6-polyprenyl-1,4-benzoquinol methylase
MANKYLSYDEQRAPKVRSMFSRLAGRYDFINDLMSLGAHRRWKRATARLALEGRSGPVRLLDVCCGTGDICFLAETEGGAAVWPIGLDFTRPMLDIAERRGRAEGSRARFVQGDALRLPFPDGSFDAITVGYGLRNIADPEAALVEMKRVLAPGGRLVVLDFGKPESALANGLYQGYLRTVMPLMGLMFHGDPQTYLYIPESLRRYPGQRGVAAMMDRLGFVNVRYENRVLGTMGLNVAESARAAAPRAVPHASAH